MPCGLVPVVGLAASSGSGPRASVYSSGPSIASRISLGVLDLEAAAQPRLDLLPAAAGDRHLGGEQARARRSRERRGPRAAPARGSRAGSTGLRCGLAALRPKRAGRARRRARAGARRRSGRRGRRPRSRWRRACSSASSITFEAACSAASTIAARRSAVLLVSGAAARVDASCGSSQPRSLGASRRSVATARSIWAGSTVSGGSRRSVPGSGTLTIRPRSSRSAPTAAASMPVLEADAEHQAAAAHLAHAVEREQALAQLRRRARGRRAAAPGRRRSRARPGRRRAATGPPAKVEPWSPGSSTSPASGVGHAGADRQAAAERLGAGQHVGADRGLLVGPERAGPPDPGLDLVEDQQRAGLVAGLAGGEQRLVADRVDAGLALDRLDQDRGGALADRLAQRRRRRRAAPSGSRAASGPGPGSRPAPASPTARRRCGRGSRARS